MRWIAVITIAATCAVLPGAPARAQDSSHQTFQRWQYFLDIPLERSTPAPDSAASEPRSGGVAADAAESAAVEPAAAAAPSSWWDFVLPGMVFTHSRPDLADLRLVDAQGRDVPYVLRIRAPDYRDERVAADQFNEAIGANGARELSFDLGENPPEHNQLEVEMDGDEYRRLAVVDGSDDGKNWSKLAERPLLHFHADSPQHKDLDIRRLRYTGSRYRYLRLRLERDPLVDKDPVEIRAVHVHRQVEAPGEFQSQLAQLGFREPTRAWNSAASAWILSVPGRNQPCTRLRVRFSDVEFARDYLIEVAGSPESTERFVQVGNGAWRRQAGETHEFFDADVAPQQISRVRLTVIDFSNPPLNLLSAEIISPVRQIVFARRDDLVGPVRLYYGNPKAEPPHYDLERNLPSVLSPPPDRLEVGFEQQNPVYEPAPEPLTERLPWLIYVVLGVTSLAVAAILVDVGRRSIALHDG